MQESAISACGDSACSGSIDGVGPHSFEPTEEPRYVGSPTIRPRLLFSSIYVWISVTGGRFMAPQLQNAGLSDSEIGVCFALQSVILSALSAKAGAVADERERRYPYHGRTQVLCWGLLIGSAFFLLHGLQHIFPNIEFFSSSPFHILLRCLYAFSTSIVFPVLDGITLDFLSKESNGGKEKYGEERLSGAIWWAVTHGVMGVSLDKWGFGIVYIYGLVATLLAWWSIVAFAKCQAAGYRCLETTERNQIEYDLNSNQPPAFKRQKSHVVEVTTTLGLGFRSLFSLLFSTPLGTAFMLAIFCLSIGMAVVESLIFLYFNVLGSSFSLCAGTVVLTVIFEIPIFQVAPALLSKFGSTKLLLLACLCYSTRVVGYSLVPTGSPWFVLLLEPLHGVTYGCATVSAANFVAKIMPEGYDASGQGILYAIRACGSVLGLLLGGIGDDILGPRRTYRVLAAIVAVGFCVLLLVSCNKQTQISQVTVAEEDGEANKQESKEEFVADATSAHSGSFAEVELTGH